MNNVDLDEVVANLRVRVAELEAREKQLLDACVKINDEVCQTLGRALGYPRYADDQACFPGATDANGVCVGEHVAESLAEEAAARIEQLARHLAIQEKACICQEAMPKRVARPVHSRKPKDDSRPLFEREVDGAVEIVVGVLS